MATQVETTQPNHVFLGACLIIGAVFLMALQDAIIKYASSNMTLWQIYVLRSSMAIPVLYGIGLYSARERHVWYRCLSHWPMLRAILLVAMYVSLYAAIPVLPLSVLAAGFYTGPLFIAALSALAIGEPVGRRGWSGIAIGFIGVLVILKPGTDAFTPMLLLTILSGFLYAVAAILARSKCQTETPLTLALSLNIVLLFTGILASALLYVWQPFPIHVAPFLLGPWAYMKMQDWGFVVILAVLIIGIGVGLAAAYQSARPVIVATFDYSYLIFSAGFGFIIFSEVPDLETIIGMSLIGFAGLFVVRR